MRCAYCNRVYDWEADRRIYNECDDCRNEWYKTEKRMQKVKHRIIIVAFVVLASLLALASCLSLPASPSKRFLLLNNHSSHSVRVYYVQQSTGQWRPLYREPIYTEQEVRVRVPERALQNGGMLLLAVEFTDGLLMKNRRQGVADPPFVVEDCTMTEVYIRYPAVSTSPTGRVWEICE